MARLFGRRSPEVPPAPPAAPARVERVVELPAPLKPLKPGSAVAAVMGAGENFDDREWQGGSSGEMLADPGPPVVTELVATELPPPEWAGQVPNPSLAREQPPAPEPPTALSVMKQAAGDIDEPRAFKAPLVMNPAPAIEIPKPDWEQELKESPEPAPAPEAAAPPPFIPPAPWSKASP